MKLPLHIDAGYRASFERCFVELAARYQVAFVPFLLEGVRGVPRLNQDDGMHPNAGGQRAIAEHIWPALKPLLDATPR